MEKIEQDRKMTTKLMHILDPEHDHFEGEDPN